MAKDYLKEYTEIGRKLVEKWEPMLRKVEDPAKKLNTAILLENQYQKGGLYEDATDGRGTRSGQTAGGANWGTEGQSNPQDIAPYQHYLLPLVRRVYPNLMANELVGVQPMTSPASIVYYLKYRYSGLVELTADTDTGKLGYSAENKGRTAPGTEYANFVGNTWNIDPYYSLQRVFREPVSGVSASVDQNDAKKVSVSLTSYDLLATPKIAASSVVFRAFITTDVGTATIAAQRTGNGTVAFTLVDTTDAGATLTDAGTLQVEDTKVKITTDPVVTFSNAVTSTSVSVTADVSYEYDMEGNRQLPEIELEVSSNPVHAQTRKLRTKWTIEASQDLRAMHNLDAEQELINLLSNEIMAEIDREIINDLIIGALIRVEYDYSHPLIVGGPADTFTVPSGTGSASVSPGKVIPGVTSYDDRNKALMSQILEVSNQIYRQSLRGAGNWIVTSPEVASKLESLNTFRPDGRTDTEYNLGIQFTGTINGQFKLYKDPLFPRNLILVGYKGQSFMDAGYFYCPYIPLQMTPTVMDPESLNPRKGLITRYGKVMVENGGRMYGVIYVKNITSVGADALPGLSPNGIGVTNGVSGQVGTDQITDPMNTDIDVL